MYLIHFFTLFKSLLSGHLPDHLLALPSPTPWALRISHIQTNSEISGFYHQPPLVPNENSRRDFSPKQQ